MAATVVPSRALRWCTPQASSHHLQRSYTAGEATVIRGQNVENLWGSHGPYIALSCGASAVPLLHFRHGPHMAKWGCVCGPLAEPTLWQLGTFLSSLKWYFGAPFIFMLSLYFSRVCFFFSFFPFRSFPFFSFLLCRFFFQYYSLPFSL